MHNDHHATKRHLGQYSQGLSRIRCLKFTPAHEAGGVMRIKSQILHGKGGAQIGTSPPCKRWRSSSQDNHELLVPYTRRLKPRSTSNVAVASPGQRVKQSSRRLKPRSTSNVAVASPGQRANIQRQPSRRLKPRSTSNVAVASPGQRETQTQVIKIK